MSNLTSTAYAAIAGEILLGLAGVCLLWTKVLSQKARESRPQSALPAWEAPFSGFLIYLILGIFGLFIAQWGSVFFLKRTHLPPETQLIILNGVIQLGVIAGFGLFIAVTKRYRGEPSTSPNDPGWNALHPERPPASLGSSIATGAAVFLISMPILSLVGGAWQYFLGRAGLPMEEQDVIGLFQRLPSIGGKAVFVYVAVIGAPLMEEMAFRAGIFRYFRTRLPRWSALVLPAILFGALHVDWKTYDGLVALLPLIAFGVILSLAYERTGRIATPIVAHALFNLNTILLLLAGVNF